MPRSLSSPRVALCAVTRSEPDKPPLSREEITKLV
jgi:hypothetical protein